MRNFEKIVTKKKRRGYDEHVEFVNKQRKNRHRRAMLGNNNNATNPKQPFDFHSAMIAVLSMLLFLYSMMALLWFLTH